LKFYPRLISKYRTMKRLKFHLCLITVVVFGTKSFSQPNCGPFYHPSTACAGSTIPVSINPVPGALSYLWIGVFNGVSGTEFGMTITSTPTNTLTISSNQPSGYILWDLRAYSGVSATGNMLVPPNRPPQVVSHGLAIYVLNKQRLIPALWFLVLLLIHGRL
jgi:hypothetical protein